MSGFFSQAFIYLAAAVLAVPLARRLGLGSALGYLIAGIVIGPFVFGMVGEEGQDVMHFAEFGVVLMLFLIGLELKPSILWRLRVPILGLGGSQVLLTALIVGLVAHLFGVTWQVATAIGMTFSLSSTAIVLQTLDEKGWMKTHAGKGGFSVLLFQDIAVIPMLALLPFLAISGDPGVLQDQGVKVGTAGWVQAMQVIGVVAGIVIGGRFLTRPVFRWIAKSRSSEILVATALLLVIGTTLAMEYVELSPALGAFLAGVVLAESEYRHELEANIEPFKGLLLGLFFISVGASIDFTLVADSPGLVFGLVLLLIGIKFPLLLVLGWLFKLKLADNLMFAFVLAQGGEFAFLLFSYATQMKVMDSDLANLMIVVVALSMVIAPLMIIVYERWVRPRFIGCVSAPPEDEVDEENPVIIAGYGRFGQIVGRLLNADGIKTTLLDQDASQIELTARFGNKVFYGDPGRVDLLRAAGADKARLLIIAFSDKEKTIKLVETVRKNFPQLKVLVRAYDRPHAYELMAAHAQVVIRETFGSALMMGEQALMLLGSDEQRAYRVMRTFKQHDETGLKKMYELWGDDKAYGLRLRQELRELEKVLQDDIQEADRSLPAD